MKILIVKTSSMGDVIHMLPALFDIKRMIKDVQIHWLLEDMFSDIALISKACDKIYKSNIRKLKNNFIHEISYLKNLINNLKDEKYDVVIDCQGLLKSAILAKFSKGKILKGFDIHSVREKLAYYFYNECLNVSQNMHAVKRLRILCSLALNYQMPSFDYGINNSLFSFEKSNDYLIFIHSTTWISKHLPLEIWQNLASVLSKRGYKIYLPNNNNAELERSYKIKQNLSNVEILPQMSLIELSHYIYHAKMAVSIDTGLAHLAAALNTPQVTLYGPTSLKLVGVFGVNQFHIQADNQFVGNYDKRCERCFEGLNVLDILEAIENLNMKINN